MVVAPKTPIHHPSTPLLNMPIPPKQPARSPLLYHQNAIIQSTKPDETITHFTSNQTKPESSKTLPHDMTSSLHTSHQTLACKINTKKSTEMLQKSSTPSHGVG
ncbi:hypothetical protein KC19_9G062800 [Ceratodon purpureus]|uniref:Uncharacterized protein n=1 Tax=Ceratodon purpureus TaxID=3225 RepID=A0A8T0GR54_CERPU|nr:hypothetical protein KC19_9G062800 [Ceratodon purpureus]